MNLQTKTKQKGEITLLVLIIIPIFIFYRFVFMHSINVPYLDDFQILNTIVRVQDEPYSWWKILLENFNGHRFGEIKLLLWIDYWVEGQVNFKTMCFIGSFFLLGFWVFCVKIMRENHIPIFYVLPFTLIVFQPIFHRNIFMMLSCFQYTQSIFFTIATYYFLAKYTLKSLILATILGVIHTQINGNAVYIFMLGALIPLYQGRYKTTVIYTIIAIITGILFYRGMPTVVGLAGYSTENTSQIRPKAIFGTLGGFLGGAFYQFTNHKKIICFLGLVLALTFLIPTLFFFFLIFQHSIKKSTFKNAKSKALLVKYDGIFRQRIILIFMAGSLLLTAVGVTITRSIFEEGVMLVERYYIYSVVSIGIAYLLLIMLTEGRVRLIIGVVALPVTLYFNLHSYYKAIPQVSFFEKSHEADIYDLSHHYTTNNKMFAFSAESLSLFQKALSRKIYKFPVCRFDTLEPILNQSINQNLSVQLAIDFTQTNQTINVYGGVKIMCFQNDTFFLTNFKKSNTFFIVLKNEGNNETYLIAPYRYPSLRKDFILNCQLYSGGFSFMIQQDSMKKGTYRVGLLIFEDNTVSLKYTLNSVKVDNTKMIEYLQKFGFYQ